VTNTPSASDLERISYQLDIASIRSAVGPLYQEQQPPNPLEVGKEA